MEFEPWSVTRSEPSGATATPTGRPQTCPLSTTNPSHEIFILSGRVSSQMQGYANQFVAHAHRSVPRSLLGGENISLILRCSAWNLFAIIEGKFQRSVMDAILHP